MTQNKKITVSDIEMATAFRQHKNAWETCQNIPNTTYKMILFYAVECGLKAYYMKENGLISSDTAPAGGKSVQDFSHNLNELLKQSNLLSFYLPDIKKNLPDPINAMHLHTAWRYGKNLDAQEEIAFILKLKQILEEIKTKLAFPKGVQ